MSTIVLLLLSQSVEAHPPDYSLPARRRALARHTNENEGIRIVFVYFFRRNGNTVIRMRAPLFVELSGKLWSRLESPRTIPLGEERAERVSGRKFLEYFQKSMATWQPMGSVDSSGVDVE